MHDVVFVLYKCNSANLHIFKVIEKKIKVYKNYCAKMQPDTINNYRGSAYTF